jgi:6-phosphofructokinase 2
MIPIVTVTLAPTVDLSSEAERVQPIHKVRTANDRFDPGGGGINVARVVTELGGDVLAVGMMGGVTGALLDELLDHEGIRRRLLPSAAQTRLSHVVHERATGLEYRFVPAGQPLAPEEYEALIEIVEGLEFRYLVASGSVPPGAPSDILARIGGVAARKDARFVLDSSGQGLKDTLGRAEVHLVKPSIGEFEAYLGRELADPQEQEKAALDVVRAGIAEIVAVTLGREGAILATGGRVLRMAAADVEVRSAVGAGDSFLAAMTLALSRGDSVPDAFLFGMAGGSAAVLTPGTQLCRRSDVERIYAEMASVHGSRSIPA